MPVVPRIHGSSNVQTRGRHAERKHVEPKIRRAAADQFRRHVVGRARPIARLHEQRHRGNRQSEIDQFEVLATVVSRKFRGQMSR